jgi:tetratricopeptide (TPR) repeat protein
MREQSRTPVDLAFATHPGPLPLETLLADPALGSVLGPYLMDRTETERQDRADELLRAFRDWCETKAAREVVSTSRAQFTLEEEAAVASRLFLIDSSDGQPTLTSRRALAVSFDGWREKANVNRLRDRKVRARLWASYLAQLRVFLATLEPQDPVEDLLARAKAKMDSSHYAEAIGLASEALTKALASESPGTNPARARNIMALSIIHGGGDHHEAWRLAQLAADDGAIMSHPPLAFQVLVTKALAALALGKTQASEAALDAATVIEHDAFDDRVLLEVRARLLELSGDSEGALALFDQARRGWLAAAETEDDEVDRNRAWNNAGVSLENKAMVLLRNRRAPAAIRALRQAVKLFGAAGSTGEESSTRRVLAEAYFSEEKWDAGLQQLNKALALTEKIQHELGSLDVLTLRARVHATLHDAPSARDDLTQALALASTSEDRFGLIYMLVNLAYEEGNHADTSEHLLALLHCAAESEDPKLISAATDLVDRLLGGGRAEASDEDIELLREEIEEAEEPRRIGHLEHRLASAHLSRKTHQEASKWFRRARNSAEKLNDQHMLARALVGLAACAVEDDNVLEASKLLEGADEAIGDLTDWEGRASIDYVRAQVLMVEGDLTGARRLLETVNEVAETRRDSSFSVQVEEQLDRVDFWLDLRRPPQRTFTELSDELHHLEDWSVDEQRPLRRLWHYQRGEEVLRNLLAYSGAKALIVSSDSSEIHQLDVDLSALFDVSTFISPESLDASVAPVEMFSVPDDHVIDYINVPTIRSIERA